MKILMVGVSEKRNGGMWTVSKNFIENKLLNSKCELFYIATSTSGNIIERLIFMIKGVIKTFILIKKEKIDIVHVHMAEKGSVFRKGIILWYARKNKCKTVIQMHAGPIKDWYNSCSLFKRKIIKKILNMTNKFLVLGDYWKKEIIEIVDESIVDVLYNGVHVPHKNNYNISSNNILFMGRINKLKGVFDLVDAVELINDRLPSRIKFILCGNDETNILKEYIDKKNLSNRFILKGWINTNEISKYYLNCKLNILPSYVEGLPMNIIEAMSFGVPTISTNITTIPELLDTDCLFEAGDYKKLSDLILKFINNESLLKEKSKIQHNLALKNFNIDSVVRKLITIYESLEEQNEK